MPEIYAIGHEYLVAISEMLRLFFHDICVDHAVQCVKTIHSDGIRIDSVLEVKTLTTSWRSGQDHDEVRDITDCFTVRRDVKRQLYQVLVIITGIRFPWGSLTGIRPTYIAKQCRYNQQFLVDHYHVSEEKAALCVETAINEDLICQTIPDDSIHCYIGIPICKTRCYYCSFISGTYHRYEQWIQPYTDAVCLEINTLFPMFENRIKSVYIGGGTPSILPEENLYQLLHSLRHHLDQYPDTEFTFEAGRPDSITYDKLKLLKNFRVTRICVNPQTMNNCTLEKIGRKHTVSEFISAYRMIREVGFETVNVDLIAGLPGESFEDFESTIHQIMELSPDQITVHSLSIKRSSELSRVASLDRDLLVNFHKFSKPNQEISDMIRYGCESLKQHMYVPYYLYRQKETAGGHENVGYSSPDHFCLYNVAMMSDRYSVLGIGAKAVSKRIYPEKTGIRVERFPDIKDIILYTKQVKQQIQRKINFFGVK
jgi:oxygen-independent coproporphyrinogen III oxidase